MQEIDVVLISHAKDAHHFQLTTACIESINASESAQDFTFNIVVVESAPDVDYAYKNVQTLHPTEPFGYHRYLNLGRKAGHAPYVCLCNNDLLFEPGWATAMVRGMNADGLLSASPFDSYSHPAKGYQPNTGAIPGYAISRELTGWCIFQKRTLYDIIGDLDEAFVFWYADDDYAQVLKQYHIRHKLLTDCFVRHVGSQTLNRLDDDEQRHLTSAQRHTFENKWKSSMINLSILIATVPTRTNQYLRKLLDALTPQVEGKPVEVLYLGDFCRMSIGTKRNELVRMAAGDYTVFIDDDDYIAADYVDVLLAAIQREPADVLTFDAVITVNGADAKLVVYSLDFKEDTFDGYTYQRRPNHLNAVRSSISKVTPFPDLNYLEDAGWATALLPKLRNQTRTERTLYYYDFNSNQSMSLKRASQDEKKREARQRAQPVAFVQPATKPQKAPAVGKLLPGITFIVPTIGRMMLHAAVGSLLNQTAPNWKAIIVFDGMKSNLQIHDERITVIEAPKLGTFTSNGNAGLVRNVALPEVTTEWVGFLDDDDTLDPNYVEYLLNARPTEDFVLFRMRGQDGRVIPAPDNDAIVLNDAGISFCARTAMLRQHHIEFINSTSEDFEFMQSMISAGLSYQVNPRIMYRVRH